jgi:hypothetical protein
MRLGASFTHLIVWGIQMFTPTQITALKYLIFKAKNGTELTKRVLMFLLVQSEGLAREVCLSLVEGREGYSSDEIHAAGLGVGAMQSCNCTTHLDAMMALMGCDLHFNFHYGDFDSTRVDEPLNNDGQFAGFRESQVSRPELVQKGAPMRYTFWFSRQDYSRDATLVFATREQLEKIDLTESSFYGSSESA